MAYTPGPAKTPGGTISAAEFNALTGAAATALQPEGLSDAMAATLADGDILWSESDGVVTGQIAPSAAGYKTVRAYGASPVAASQALAFKGAYVSDESGLTVVDVSTLPTLLLEATADQALTQSSTTTQNLTGFEVPVDVGQVWVLDGQIHYIASTAAGFKLQIALSSGTTASIFGLYVGLKADNATIAQSRVSNQTAQTFGTNGGSTAAIVEVRLKVAITAVGTTPKVLLKGSQNTADATAITIKQGSWLAAARVA